MSSISECVSKKLKVLSNSKHFHKTWCMRIENMELTDRLYWKLAGDDIKQIISRSISERESQVLIDDILDVIAKHQKKKSNKYKKRSFRVMLKIAI